MKILHILLLLCIISAITAHNDVKARLIQKQENNKKIETIGFLELGTTQFDPNSVLRTMEDIKAKAALRQAALERENKIHELESKLEDLGMDKRRAAERLQGEEIGVLEKRVMKMEEVSNQLARSARQQIELLKQIREHQRAGPKKPENKQEHKPPGELPIIPLIDTAALDFVFKKVIAEIHENPPSPVASNRTFGNANANAPMTGPLGSIKKPVIFSGSSSIVTQDTYAPKPTSTTVSLPSTDQPSGTQNNAGGNARFATVTDITNAITRALADYRESPKDVQRHGQHEALSGLVRPAIVPRIMLHNFPSTQQSLRDLPNPTDSFSNLPLVAEYRN